MKKSDLAILKLSEIESDSKYMIKNFIASNSTASVFSKSISFDHPCSFQGIIFGICIRGEIKMIINLREYVIRANTIFTILPNSIFESLGHSEDVLLEILAFTDEFVTYMPPPKNVTILKDIALNPVLQISDENFQSIFHYHSFIIEIFETRKGSIFISELIKGLLYSLITELTIIYAENSVIDKNNKGRYEELAERFVRLLLEKFREERTVAYYANELFVTPKHLSQVLKEITGRTISSWIDEVVILGAKSLLKSTNDTVLQISEALNFPTASYFGRYFRRLTGLTPLEYREL